MKVLILGGSNSRNSGGVYVTAQSLGINLTSRNEVNMHYLMHNDEYSVEDRKHYYPMTLHDYDVKGPTNFGFSNTIYSRLKMINPDIIHTQSIWMYLSLANKKYHSKTSTPYIVSPHGMLDEWQLKQSSLKKKIALAVYERKHLKNATCIHALCQSEYDSIRALNLTNPVAIIPNGIDLPFLSDDSIKTIPPWSNLSNKKTLLFLSRIHPKKGIDNLLHAWYASEPRINNWQLIIAGETKDNLYMQTLVSKVKELNISDSVQFIGGKYGSEKNACYQNADCFILPSFSEGLPVAVLEAWSYKLPSLITSYCNLPEGFDRNAAIKIETDIDSITKGIQNIFLMTDIERSQMGRNGYNLVKDEFTWEKVSNKMYKLYKWATGKEEMPDFVIH